MKNYAELCDSLPDLTGKAFAITGTTSGTGFVAAQTVAEKGGMVLLLNRPSERSVASLDKLKAAVPEARFIRVDCDLQDFDSVRAAAKAVGEAVDALYCLSNNAGVMALPNRATKDGYDVQMQTNHLSHFLLTKELFPLLARGAAKHGEGRVVHHSSSARNRVPGGCLAEEYLRESGLHLGDNEMDMRNFGGGNLERYAHSKLANTVFTSALSRRIGTSSSPAVRSIRSVAAHPGVAMTNLCDHLRTTESPTTRDFSHLNSVEDATMGLLYGMASPDAMDGMLYGPKNDSFKGPSVPTTLEPHETDKESGDMLWKASEEATSVKFNMING